MPTIRIRAGFVFLVAVMAFASAARAQATNQIKKVNPASAAAGTSNLLVTFTLDTDAPPAPPAGILPTSVTIGSVAGSAVTHSSQYVVTAVFTFPASEPPGAKDCAIVFPTPSGTVTFSSAGGFTVTPPPNTPPTIVQQPASQVVPAGDPVTFTVSATGSAPLRYQWQKNTLDIAGATGASYAIASAGVADAGSYRAVVSNDDGTATSDPALLTVDTSVQVTKATYPVVETSQAACYGESAAIPCPAAGQPWYGQDAQFQGYQPRFTKSADGLTVEDRVTGLTWQHTTDTNGDGTIDATDKFTWTTAQARPAVLNAQHYGGFSDWRLPTIKEQYSLIDFRGTDPSGATGNDTSGLTPFIDRTYFDYNWGDTSAGERVIDSQYASSTMYVVGTSKLFGVNFADGRIKGYDLVTPNGGSKTFYLQCVRGNPAYGINAFVDNGDLTVTDRATGLMWTKQDSGAAMNWQDALAWVQAKNAARHLGYDDWRLPSAKELQSLLDYTRAPDATGSAAIAPVFETSSFTGELCSTEYPWYWTSTTHASSNGSASTADYLCFGRAPGYMNGSWVDVHGAGAQRSDPKVGSLSNYTYAACGWYNSVAPQGDAVRITNYVRPVRGGAGPLRAAFSFAPELPTDTTPVTFTASGSGGTSPYAYAWDLGGTHADGASATSSFASGVYAIVLTVTDAAGLVTTITQSLTVGASAPPPVADGLHAGIAATFTRRAAGLIDVTYGVTPCSAPRASILYGRLGDYAGYTGCAVSDAGSAGTATIDASALGSAWFNIVWTNGTTAGHPGFASSSARSWRAAGFCGLLTDDHGRDACP